MNYFVGGQRETYEEKKSFKLDLPPHAYFSVVKDNELGVKGWPQIQGPSRLKFHNTENRSVLFTAVFLV